MSALPLNPRLKPAIVVAVSLLLIVSLIPMALAQWTAGVPLQRSDNEGHSVINDRQAAEQLDSSDPWVSGLDPLNVTLRYRCGPGGSTQTTCNVGDGPGATRTAYFLYTLDETNPRISETAEELEIEGSNPTTLVVAPNPIAFADDSILSPDDFEGLQEGDWLKFTLRVPLSATVGNVPSGNCDGDETPCFDPFHTSGEDYYGFRVDLSEPRFVVQEPANAVLFELDDEEWWMFTNEAMTGSGLIPDIAFHVVDNQTGAPLDPDATLIEREGDDETGNFNRLGLSDHEAVYTYEPNGDRFEINTANDFSVIFADRAGNRAENATALRVLMDHTAPQIDLDESRLSRVGSDSAPAALGDPMRVEVDAIDMAGGGVETPPELLNVEVRLFTEDRRTVAEWQSVSFNETEGLFFSTDVRLPSDEWESGQTFAEVRVIDVVGNQAGPVQINGAITVDAEIPVIEPVAPLGEGDDFAFSADEAIEFIIRAFDPGNSDEWDGANTENTDGFGINFDTVQLHYRIGEEGSRTAIVLQPQEAENTFRVLRSFGELVEVYHFFSAEDHAGNRITYPGPNDPHHQIDAAGNDGRYLLLHTDRVGPDIDPSRDHAFLGGPGDHEYRFNITDDPGVGLDDETPQLHWRLQGDPDYTPVRLTESQVEHDLTGEPLTAFTASIPRQQENQIVEYYVEAMDLLGNVGTFGTADSPETTRIDLTPPTMTVTAPSVSNTNRFTITWQGQDEISGVRDYTVQFRVAGGNWHTAPDLERTTSTSWEVCAATGVVYEFRVSARDNAGNERAFPEIADATTQVNAPESCTQPPTVSLTAPGDGDTLTGEVEVAWEAVSTVFPDELSVRIETDGTLVAEGLAPSGEHLWDTSTVRPNEPCFPDGSYTLSVVALDIGGLEATDEITVTLQNGITSRDCEDRHPSSTLFGDEPGEFNPLYLLVVVAFVGLAAVFTVGMARRW